MMDKDKKRGLDAIAPPPRKASGNMAATAESTKVQFNVRISSECSTYAKVLAAKTGRPLNELVEEALGLLRDKYGEA